VVSEVTGGRRPDPGAGPERVPRVAAWVAVGVVVLVAVSILVGIALRGGAGGGGKGTGALVCLDPGHGGSDTGAKDNGVLEKDVNLDIALRAKALLEAKGYHVIMTRDSDTNVSLAKRCAIANAAGAAVFVSIHNNARPPDVAGTTTYCYRYSPKGRKLATYIQLQVVSHIKQPDRGVRGAGLYVLKNANMPAALLECVFLTDAREARLIGDPAFRQKIAEGVAAGTVEYLKSGGG
jgi:N-acetylmuramoyl-L-alanine amidase